MRKRRASVQILALLATGLLFTAITPTYSASAAPVRHEAENATIVQGVAESTHVGFSGTGYVNYNNMTGSYVEWEVDAAAGSTTLTFRYANGTTVNRPMRIEVNGTVVAAGHAFNGTGAWTSYASTSLTATLRAGSNTIRATANTADGGPNVDYLETDQAAPSTDFQAEDATISQGVVESNHAGFTGTGFVNYNNVAGSYVQWTVNSTAGGPTALVIRYANGGTANRPMDISVGGNIIANDQAFNPTGAWSTWATVSIPATLEPGNNLIRATAVAADGGPNVDRLSLGGDAVRPTVPGPPSCSNIGQTTLTLTWGASTDNVGVVAYDIYHDGTKIDEAPGSATTRNLTNLNPNFTYRLSVFARDAAGNVSDSSALATCQTLPVEGDTTPPTAPTNLVHSNVGQTTVNLTWTGSTDVGTGVRAYLVRNAANAVIHTVTGNPPATSTTVPNLPCGQQHTLHVVARDGANNISGPSNSRTFTTTACGRGQPQTPTNVSTGWTIPWDIDWAPSGQFALITERDHFRVWRLSLTGQKTQVGTVPNSVTTDGEGGLMGVAFSPTWNGTTDQEVFFMHTSNDGGATQNRIVKMNFNGTSLSNRQVIVSGIRSSRFHNGGRIKFGPDGFLYATTGDAQQENNGPQDRNSLNGKILRITKTGAAAPGNPFGNRTYSYGHRNPQGLAWDSQGRLWESELMNNANDELNLIQAGGNYGWPMCQGSCNVPGTINPKRTWSVAEASPSGIAIVNDTVYMAALRGQRLWRIELNGTNVGTVSNHFVNTFGRLRAVSKVPGASAIWIGTTNADNNGGAPDGADRILRSNIQ